MDVAVTVSPTKCRREETRSFMHWTPAWTCLLRPDVGGAKLQALPDEGVLSFGAKLGATCDVNLQVLSDEVLSFSATLDELQTVVSKSTK